MQSPHFDVYTDPWIEADYIDKGKRIISPRTAFRDAHKIQDFRIPGSSFYIGDAAIMKYMTTMLADAKHFSTNMEKFKSFRKEQFDADEIDEYYEECKKKEISFDIFDEKRPFLQTSNIAGFKPAAVGSVYPPYPTGNNTVFGGSPPENVDTSKMKVLSEKCYVLTIPQYISAVLYSSMCRPANGAGYKGCGVTKGYTIPVYFMPRGKNLFETLLINTPLSPNKNDRPMWAWNEYQPDISKMSAEGIFGPCASAFYPVITLRYGTIGETKSGDPAVKSVYVKALEWKSKKNPDGKPVPSDFSEQFIKNDMNVLRRKNSKTGEIFSIQYDADADDAWYDVLAKSTTESIGLGIHHDTQEFLRILQRAKKIPKTGIPCRITAMKLNLASGGTVKNMQGQWNGMLPENVIDDGAVFDLVSDVARKVKDYAYGKSRSLKYAFTSFELAAGRRKIQSGKDVKDEIGKGHISEQARNLIYSYEEYEKDCLNDWIEKIGSMDIASLSDEEMEALKEEFLEEARRELFRTYDDYRVTNEHILYKAYCRRCLPSIKEKEGGKG